MTDFEKLKSDIIKELFKNEGYAEFLCGQPLADIQMIDMICAAPISLERKAEMLKSLSAYQNGNEDDYYSYKTYCREIRKALSALTLKEGEIFLLVGYEKGASEPIRCCVAPSKDAERVTEYIKREYFPDNERDIKTCDFWFLLEKWHAVADGEKVEDYFIGDMNNDYTFTLLNGELCYFYNRSDREKLGLEKRKALEKLSLFYSGSSLNLPTSWESGDILEVVATPFTPKTKVLVLSNSNPLDCCSPCCMYLCGGGLMAGALKHSHIYKRSVYENVSPLYSVKRFTGELKKGEKILKVVGDYIKGNAEKGEEIFEHLCKSKKPVSPEEMTKYIMER